MIVTTHQIKKVPPTAGYKDAHAAHYVRYQPVAIKEHVETVALNDLPDDEKQQIWQGIKRLNPALAAAMQNDATLKAFITELGGKYTLTPAEITHYKGQQ